MENDSSAAASSIEHRTAKLEGLVEQMSLQMYGMSNDGGAADSSMEHRMTKLEGLVEQMNLRMWSLQGAHKEMKERMDAMGVGLELNVNQHVDKLATAVSRRTSGQEPGCLTPRSQPFDWVDIVERAMTEAQAKVCQESSNLPPEDTPIQSINQSIKKLSEEADNAQNKVETVQLSSQSSVQINTDSCTSLQEANEESGQQTDAVSQVAESRKVNVAAACDPSQVVEHLQNTLIKYLSSDFQEHVVEAFREGWAFQSMQPQPSKQVHTRSHARPRDGAAGATASSSARKTSKDFARQQNRSGRASPRATSQSTQPQASPPNSARRQNGSRRASPRPSSQEPVLETPNSMQPWHSSPDSAQRSEYKRSSSRSTSQEVVIETLQSIQQQQSRVRDSSARVTTPDSSRDYGGSRGASPRVTPHGTPRMSPRKMLNEKPPHSPANKNRLSRPGSASVPVSAPGAIPSFDFEDKARISTTSQFTLTASGASLTAPDATAALADVAVAAFENQRAVLEASGTPRKEINRASSPDKAIDAKTTMLASGSDPVLVKHVTSPTSPSQQSTFQQGSNSPTGNFSASQLIAKLQPAYTSMHVQKRTSM